MSSQDFKDWESALHIDPLILRHLQKKSHPPVASHEDRVVKQRNLGVLYAAFMGVGAMIMVILLGVIRYTDVDMILVNSSRALLVYGIIGFIAGKIGEMCLNESAKSMIRKMLQRTDQLASATANDIPEDHRYHDDETRSE